MALASQREIKGLIIKLTCVVCMVDALLIGV